MNSVFKVMTVVITVLSVGFMGTAIAMYYGHPDVRSEMSSDAMQAYSFANSGGETPSWTVTRRFGPEDQRNLGSFPNPLQALTRAHDDLRTQLATETSDMQALTDQITGSEGETARFRAAQEQDREAAVRRRQQLSQVAAQLQAQLQQLSAQEQSLAEEAKQIQLETASRRTDVMRLQNELEEARTDLFRLSEIRRELTDELVRLQLDLQGLQSRIDQMEGN